MAEPSYTDAEFVEAYKDTFRNRESICCIGGTGFCRWCRRKLRDLSYSYAEARCGTLCRETHAALTAEMLRLEKLARALRKDDIPTRAMREAAEKAKENEDG